MRYKLKYSPDASDKLRKLNRQITGSNGKQVATRIVSRIMGEIRGLQNNPEKIIETFIQCIPYTGFPKVLNAIFVAKKIFKERKINLAR